MTIAPRLPLAAALSSLVSVQVGGAFAKTRFPQVGPEGVAALRLGLAALVLVLWLLPLGSMSGSLKLKGLGYAALAGMFWGLYVIVGKKLRR